MSTHRVAGGRIVFACDHCGAESVPLAPLDERDTPQGIAGHAPAPRGWSWNDFPGRLVHSCSECSLLVDISDPTNWPQPTRSR